MSGSGLERFASLEEDAVAIRSEMPAIFSGSESSSDCVRAGDHDGIAVFGEAQDQVAHARKRRNVRQVALAKDLPAPLGDARALAAVVPNARDVRHQLVAAHADGPAHAVGGHVDRCFIEGVDPGLGVGVVAVDERTRRRRG